MNNWNIFEILLLLTLTIGIVLSVPVNILNNNGTLESLSKTNSNVETKNLLLNTTEFETIRFRQIHIDEDSPKISDSDEDDDETFNDLKYQVEILQPGKIEKENLEIEERFKRPSLNFDTNEFFEENIEVNAQTMQQGHVILTITLFALAFVSIGIYVGLVIWRSNLERRYGMRQRLMTEDDFCTNVHDVRPF